MTANYKPELVRIANALEQIAYALTSTNLASGLELTNEQEEMLRQNLRAAMPKQPETPWPKYYDYPENKLIRMLMEETKP